MIDEPFLRTLGILVVAAAVASLLVRRIRLPSIVGYLAAGLVAGPGLGLVGESDQVAHLSEAGVVLLLFLIGLEMNLAKIRHLGGIALRAGTLQLVLTFALGWGVAAMLGLRLADAAMIGAALAFSSTVVAIKLLEEKRQMGEAHGRIALGVLLVQDVAVILLLTVVSALGGGGEDGGPGSAGLGRALGIALVGVAATVGLVAAASRWLLPRPFAWASRSPDCLFIWSLCWCFGMVLLAHAFHLSPEIGAFLAGVALAQLPYAHELRRRVRPMMNFFLAVFFVSLGVGLDPGAVVSQGPAVIVLTAFVLLVKPLVIAGVVARLGFGARTAALSGIALGQVSEFSLIVAAIGLRGGLVSPDTVALIGAVALASFALSAVAITFAEPLADRAVRSGLLRWLRPAPADPLLAGHDEAARRHGHVIVVGMNTLGRRIARDVTARGWEVLAVDTDPGKLRGLPCATLHGSASDLPVLDEADLDHARLLVSALRIEEANDWLAFQCHQRGVPCAIHVIDLVDIDLLLEMDPAYLIVSKVDGIKDQTRTLKELGLLEAAESEPASP